MGVTVPQTHTQRDKGVEVIITPLILRRGLKMLQKLHKRFHHLKNPGTDGNGRPISSYSRNHERSRKRKIRHSANGLDYNTSLAYTLTKNID